MKQETTAKYIRNAYTNVIRIGYCDAANLFLYEEPTYYTHGVYGWNADIYYINNDTVIVTGYRPFGNIKPNFELTREYNDKAREIIVNRDNNEKATKELETLIKDYINKVLNA